MDSKLHMEQLVSAQLQAYNRRDIAAFCACFHKDVVVTNLISNQVRCEGKEKFTTIYNALFEENPNLKCELKSRIILETTVIDEEVITGVVNAPNGIHTAAMYGFKDGLIDRVWFPK